MIPEGYNLSNLRGAIKNPERFREEYYRRKEQGYRRAIDVNGRYYRWRRRDTGIDVMAADWDNLILLDACRPEILDRVAPDFWNVEKRRSSGSDSREFIQKQFMNGPYHDTVYLTANPWAYILPSGQFHYVRNLLETDWNEKYRTVLPEDMVEAIKSAAANFENKRLIAHFMQPHFPFLGPTGQEFNHEGIQLHLPDGEREDSPDPWRRQMFVGDIGHERLVTAYRENHELVVTHIETLLDELKGRTVITADHANLLGEWTGPLPIRVYGHPSEFHKRELITVPWVVFHGETRRTITEDDPIEAEPLGRETVEERLRSLGYV